MKVVRIKNYKLNESNSRKINEARVSVSGTHTETDIYPVPYDDDYVERYGATEPRDEYKSEN